MDVVAIVDRAVQIVGNVQTVHVKPANQKYKQMMRVSLIQHQTINIRIYKMKTTDFITKKQLVTDDTIDREDRPLPDVNPVDVEITATLLTSYDSEGYKTIGELRNAIKADLVQEQPQLSNGWAVTVYIQGEDD